MTNARLAYVNARIRGRKAGRLSRDDLVRLAMSDAPSAFVPGWQDLGPDDDPEPLLLIAYRRLIGEYDMAVRAAPDLRAVLLALIGLHESENVKLAWRAIAARRPREAWVTSWRPLGPLATVDRDACAHATTVRALVDVLGKTPYGEAARAALRAHADDPAAAELALDRAAAARLQDAIARLPPGEVAARDLLGLVLREREAAAAQRDGRNPPIRTAQIRARRRIGIARAFERTPYCIAPLVAYVLRCEDELRGLLTVAESRAQRLEAVDVRRILDAMR